MILQTWWILSSDLLEGLDSFSVTAALTHVSIKVYTKILHDFTEIYLGKPLHNLTDNKNGLWIDWYLKNNKICDIFFKGTFIHSIIPPFIHSFLHSFFTSLPHLLIPSLFPSFPHLFIQSFLSSFPHSLIPSCNHSFLPSFHPSFLHSFFPSLIH